MYLSHKLKEYKKSKEQKNTNTITNNKYILRDIQFGKITIRELQWH